jgi:hypothetical protein
MPILSTESWKIVIPEGDGSSCRSCGNILLMDPPCDQRGLRCRGRLDEPQGDCLSISHALGVTAILTLEGHPSEEGELRLLRYCEFSRRSLLNLARSQSGEALDESFEPAFADRCPALALGIQCLIVAFMPEDALPATLDVAFD